VIVRSEIIESHSEAGGTAWAAKPPTLQLPGIG
jgi:hypothetical protein